MPSFQYIGIPFIKIWLSHDHVIFIIGKSHGWKDGLYIETEPQLPDQYLVDSVVVSSTTTADTLSHCRMMYGSPMWLVTHMHNLGTEI